MRLLRSRRWLWRLLLALAAGIILVAAFLYVQASRVPAGYEPAQLSLQQRQAAAGEFVNWASPLYNQVQPFTIVATETQLNRYLASMDEIAFLRVGGKRGEVQDSLRQVGLSDPALRLRDGAITLMARSDRLGKVVSVNFSLSVNAEHEVQAHLRGVRVGRLPLPLSAVRERLDRLKQSLQKPADDDSAVGRSAGDDMGKIALDLLIAVDAEPVRVEHTINNRRLLLDALEVSEGRIALRFTPLPASPDASADGSGR